MRNLYTKAASCCLRTLTIVLLSFPVTTNAQELMRANLYVVDANGTTLVDGNLTNYNNIYSNAVDINDAWKMINPGINFGILREENDLVVERRSIVGISDTTFFKMWNLPQYHYRIRFVLKNMNHPGLKAVVKDNYLNSESNVLLNDTTYYDFMVDANAASGAEGRFQLIYGAAVTAALEVNFTGIQAQRKAKDVLVEWSVADEVSMESYTIEHSTDGRSFHDLTTVKPYNTQTAKTYDYTDMAASAADNFYRIRALSFSGKIQYSSIARINSLSGGGTMNVYPNPVVNKTVQLQYADLQTGKYDVALIYANGTRQQLTPMQLSAGQGTKSVQLPLNILPGIYQLQFTGVGNTRMVKSIQVL